MGGGLSGIPKFPGEPEFPSDEEGTRLSKGVGSSPGWVRIAALDTNILLFDGLLNFT